MATHAQLKSLRGAKKAPTGTTAEFKQETVAALAAAGLSAPLDASEEAGPHSVLALLNDDGGTVRLWCIPDANLDATDRARLDRVNGRCFATFFVADLAPEQFAGALLVLVRTGLLQINGPSDGLLQEIAAEFTAEGMELPDADWATIRGNVWGGRDASAGLGPIALTNLYCVHVAQ